MQRGDRSIRNRRPGTLVGDGLVMSSLVKVSKQEAVAALKEAVSV